MKFTEEEIAQVRNDKMLRNLANLFGVDFDKVLEEAIKDAEAMDEPTPPAKEGETHKEYVKPEAKTQPFLMNAEQLKKFIKDYRTLIEAEKRMKYLYGVDFQEGGSGFSFPTKVNEIIWDLMRIIFGDENAEDIADYIFGNSNFDNVESLYDELV